MRVRVLLLALGLGLAAPAPAQEDDGGGFLERLIESNLSSAGREVRIEGFAGALSSRATLDRMTIADEAGVWLTLTDAALDWNRAALLRGRLEVNELVAGTIAIARPPQPPEGFTPPPAAAPGFALPDLPVAVNVRTLRAGRLELGAPVLGQAAVLRLDAAVTLDADTGLVRLDLERIDGREGTIALGAGIDRATGQARIDLTAREGAGGIVAGLTGIPGAPALALTFSGLGPPDDFNASLRLASDGQERLAGTMRLAGAPDGTPDGALAITADLGGDIAPLLLPEHAAFFGPDMTLRLDALRSADGALTVEAFEADAAAVTLSGSARIAADGLPERADLVAHLADPAGGAVLLPLPGTPVRVGAADLRLTLDAGAWTLDATLDALDAAAADVAQANVTGRGSLGRDPQRVTGRIEAALSGLA
ncbi:MAG: translocation and assembly module protein TamB, partial [Rhodobacteraceae bacterium]|nr:translocation and assembly module protein TamB [Paracoccaceae bacterium]